MRKKGKIVVSGFLATVFMFLAADPVLAVDYCASGEGVETALGCLPFNVNDLTVEILQKLVPILGAVALLLMIYGSFLITTSAGNPDKAKTGREVITAAISGLIFTIFSLFLLRFIGIDILHIPGLQ